MIFNERVRVDGEMVLPCKKGRRKKQEQRKGIEKQEKELDFLVQQKKIRKEDFLEHGNAMGRKITTHFFNFWHLHFSPPL